MNSQLPRWSLLVLLACGVAEDPQSQKATEMRDTSGELQDSTGLSLEWRFRPNVDTRERLRALVAVRASFSLPPDRNAVGVVYEFGESWFALLSFLPASEAGESRAAAVYLLDPNAQRILDPWIVGSDSLDAFPELRIVDLDDDGRVDLLYCSLENALAGGGVVRRWRAAAAADGRWTRLSGFENDGRSCE